MPKISSVIKQHDEKVLSSSQTNKNRQCNCRNPVSCSLDGKCLTKTIAYKAVVSPITDFHTYYRSSEDFKFHYSNHTKAFLNQHYKNYTKLSKHISDLKNTGIHHNIAWSIAAYASAYRCGPIRCDLCITEKHIIARANQNNLLKKRTEMVSKCRHKIKFIPKNIK